MVGCLTGGAVVALGLFDMTGRGPGESRAHVEARNGADRIAGSPAADRLNGHAGDDVVGGRGGDDTLHGGRGNDTVFGEGGDDLISGDRGSNLLVGGEGSDRFILSPLGGRDVVADFDGDAGDRVVVQNGLQLSVQADGDDAVLGLDDGSQMRMSNVTTADVGRWLLRAHAPRSWSELRREGGFVGALLVAVGGGAAAAVGLLGGWRRWRRAFGIGGAPTGAGTPPSGNAETRAPADMPRTHVRSAGLDAMRATAILLVLASHWSSAMLPWFGLDAPGQTWLAGELGVVLFFSLSGFLIGQILITQAGVDASWRNFHIFIARRWMRTLPLYFLVLAILLIFAPPSDRLVYGLRYATLTQNVLAPMPPGGFFAITWSLTVEEWFYLLFGGTVFLSFRVWRRPWAIWPPLLIFLLAPLALRLWAPHTPEALYRLDQIAYGAAMAQLYRQGSPLFRRPGACLAVGVVLLGAAWWCGGLPEIPVAPFLVLTSVGCSLLIPAALLMPLEGGWIRGLIGSVSALAYPLYLIHLDILGAVTTLLRAPDRASAWVCVAIATAAPFLLAYLSFRFFESPILRLRPSHPTERADRMAPQFSDKAFAAAKAS